MYKSKIEQQKQQQGNGMRNKTGRSELNILNIAIRIVLRTFAATTNHFVQCAYKRALCFAIQ